MSDVTKDTGFETGTALYTSTLTANGTVAVNTNRVLIGVAVFSARSATLGSVTMTWDGVSMTAISNLDFPGGGTGSVYMFGLTNPNTGSKSLVVNSNVIGATTAYLGALSLYNASGWQNSGNDSGTGTGASVASSTVTSANHNMAVVGHGNRNANTTALDAPAVQAWIDTAHDNNGGQGGLLSSSASTIISYTLSGPAVAWVNIKTDVIATAAAHPLTVDSGSLALTGQAVTLRPGSTTYLRYRK